MGYIRKDHDETEPNTSKYSRYGYVREYELTQLAQLILLPVIEIDCKCVCTWVYHFPSGKHRLKFKNKICSAIEFHRKLELSTLNGG